MIIEAYTTISAFMFIMLILVICNDTKNMVLSRLSGVWLALAIVTISLAWPLSIAILFVRAVLLYVYSKGK